MNKPISSLRALAKQSSNWIAASGFALLAMTIMLFSNIALADEPSVYSPEACDFSVTFPGEPFSKNICDENNSDRCYDEISYTQVYDMDASVNVKVICNEVDADVSQHYDSKIMQATLRAMTKGTVVKTFDTSFREEEGYKQAGLVGEGHIGRTPTIYIAQLWISPKSALSVEAQLVGETNEAADALFSDILKSVRFKERKE